MTELIFTALCFFGSIPEEACTKEEIDPVEIVIVKGEIIEDNP